MMLLNCASRKKRREYIILQAQVLLGEETKKIKQSANQGGRETKN